MKTIRWAVHTRKSSEDGLEQEFNSLKIAPLRLDARTFAELLGIDPEYLDQINLDRSFPFQLRKRGVETKIILNNAPSGTDDTLICNIAKTHAWFERIKAGETVSEIAANEATS